MKQYFFLICMILSLLFLLNACGDASVESTEACNFVREHCDDYGECSICGAIAEPEAHDWSPEEVREDCLSCTITKTCYKCGLENWTHADYFRPDHIWKEETKDGKTTYSCTRCKESYVMVGEIGSFSYAEVLEAYKIGDPGVEQKSFYMSIDNGIAGVTDAITMARYYVTVSYDTIAIAYDETTGVWCVDFYTLDVVGGNQAIYVNPTEEICYIVYGE